MSNTRLNQMLKNLKKYNPKEKKMENIETENFTGFEIMLEESSSVLTQGTFGKYPKSIGKMYGGGF